MESLILVRLDSKYCDYLRQFDKRFPYNYDKKELRPFIGVLFEVNDCKYFALQTLMLSWFSKNHLIDKMESHKI